MTASQAATAPAPQEQIYENCTIIAPRLELKQRALRPASKCDIDRMLESAEQKVEELKPEFGEWMDREVEALRASLDIYLADNGEGEARELLYRSLHNVRGNAETFGHALAGNIADSMCKLFDAAKRVPNEIVMAHVQAIQAVVREKATALDHPIGSALIRELQRAAVVVRLLEAES